MDNSKHIKKFGFEYARFGSLAVAKIFGVLVYVRVGNGWRVFPLISKGEREIFKCR